MTQSDSPTARATAHRLLAPGMPNNGTPDAVAGAVERVLAQLFRSLSQWIGTVGCNALFARALVLSAPHHPVLRGVKYHVHHGTPQLECLAENAHEYGSHATAEGATTILASIITMLNGLIGEDIAMSILDEVPTRTPEPPPAAMSGTSTGRASKTATRTGEGEAAS